MQVLSIDIETKVLNDLDEKRPELIKVVNMLNKTSFSWNKLSLCTLISSDALDYGKINNPELILKQTEYLESICVDFQKMSRFKSIVQSRTCGKVHPKMRLTQSTQ
jgi:hypothetical protein